MWPASDASPRLWGDVLLAAYVLDRRPGIKGFKVHVSSRCDHRRLDTLRRSIGDGGGLAGRKRTVVPSASAHRARATWISSTREGKRMRRTDWRRTSRERRCPICGKPDWCLYTGPDDAPTAAICARIESGKRVGEAGWLHLLRENDDWRTPSRRIRTVRGPSPVGQPDRDLGYIAWRCHEVLQASALGDLARSLGLSAESLSRLMIGWSTENQAWTFPMRDAAGEVVGIRLRKPDGRKLAIKGGREGLFLPEGLEAGNRLLVCEGPTDTAALLDLGLQAIGRPSCTGGVKHLCELTKRLRPAEMVVVADADRPGMRGAERLASALLAYCPAVRVISPPNGVKDARDWKASGATAGDVEAAITRAEIRRLNVVTREAGEKS